MEEQVTFVSDGLKLVGRPARSGGRSRAARPRFSCCTASAATRTAAARSPPRGSTPSLGYVTLRFDMRGCGAERGPARTRDLPRAGRGHEERARVSRRAVRGGPAAHRRVGTELRRGGRDLRGGRRRAGRRVRLVRRLGRRREEIPQAARFARGVAAVHGHDGARAGGSASAPASPSWCRATTSSRSRPACAATCAQARSWSSRSRWSRPCTRSPPTTWSGRIAPRPLLLLHSSNDSVTPDRAVARSLRPCRAADRPAPHRGRGSFHVRGGQHAGDQTSCATG